MDFQIASLSPYLRRGVLPGEVLSTQPSSDKHSQAILDPLMDVIQDMCLNDTYKGRGYS